MNPDIYTRVANRKPISVAKISVIRRNMFDSFADFLLHFFLLAEIAKMSFKLSINWQLIYVSWKYILKIYIYISQSSPLCKKIFFIRNNYCTIRSSLILLGPRNIHITGSSRWHGYSWCVEELPVVVVKAWVFTICYLELLNARYHVEVKEFRSSNRKRKRNLESKGTTEKVRAPRSLHLFRDKQSLTMEACCGDKNWQIQSGKSESSITPLAKQCNNLGTNIFLLLLIPTDAWM